MAYPATATITLWPTALHVDIEHRKHETVAIEAHDAETHLHAQRDIVPIAGVFRLAALKPDRAGNTAALWISGGYR